MQPYHVLVNRPTCPHESKSLKGTCLTTVVRHNIIWSAGGGGGGGGGGERESEINREREHRFCMKGDDLSFISL